MSDHGTARLRARQLPLDVPRVERNHQGRRYCRVYPRPRRDREPRHLNRDSLAWAYLRAGTFHHYHETSLWANAQAQGVALYFALATYVAHQRIAESR